MNLEKFAKKSTVFAQKVFENILKNPKKVLGNILKKLQIFRQIVFEDPWTYIKIKIQFLRLEVPKMFLKINDI